MLQGPGLTGSIFLIRDNVLYCRKHNGVWYCMTRNPCGIRHAQEIHTIALEIKAMFMLNMSVSLYCPLHKRLLEWDF